MPATRAADSLAKPVAHIDRAGCAHLRMGDAELSAQDCHSKRVLGARYGRGVIAEQRPMLGEARKDAWPIFETRAADEPLAIASGGQPPQRFEQLRLDEPRGEIAASLDRYAGD